MPFRLLGLIFAGLLLTSCAGADLPGFADSAVEATTGVNPQQEMERRMDPDRRARELEAQQNEIGVREEITAADTDTRSLASLMRLYSNWSVLLVAGDYRASTGAPTDAFDNARRAMAQNLQGLGFDAANMAQLSVRPERYGDPRVHSATYENINNDLRAQRQEAVDGCMVYITSHGTPQGVSMGETGIVAPDQLNEILENNCVTSPTIVIVSACYSGSFAAGDMAQPNRIIMTAARSDRASFGCGEGDRYPYFDNCLFQSFPQSADWIDFARNVRGCVQSREQAEGLTPPSSPQVFIGEEMRDIAESPFLAGNFGSSSSGF